MNEEKQKNGVFQERQVCPVVINFLKKTISQEMHNGVVSVKAYYF